MYSLEVLAAITGDARLGDRLEMLAFNALPATFKKDMTAHQYDQQCNQVRLLGRGRACLREQRGRLESLWTRAKLRLLHGQHAPGLAQVCQPLVDEERRRRAGGHRLCAVRDRYDRSPASPCVSRSLRKRVIRLATHGESRIVIKVQPAAKSRFSLHLRIPSWGEGATCGVWDDATTFERINDLKPGSFLTLNREWGVNPPTEINLTVPMPVRLRDGYQRCGLDSARAGDLCAGDRTGVEDCSKTGLACRLMTGRFSRSRRGTTHWKSTASIPRGRSNLSRVNRAGLCSRLPVLRLSAKVKGRRLPGWKLERGAAAPPPSSPVASQEPLEELTLVPLWLH